MIAAPTLIPLNPLGAKLGVVHCSGRTYLSPTIRNSPMIPTLIATITVFTRADSFVPMTSSHVMTAAKALVAPARMIDTTIADPAPTCPASPLIAVPIAAKIPAPMMAPMPSAVSCSGPSERCRPPPASPSAMHWSTVLRRNSGVALDKQRRQHQRDRAQQLDEHVERWAGGVLERIADRVTHDRRLVGGAALPAVLTRLDVFLGIVPRPAAVVQHRGDQDAADRAHH